MAVANGAARHMFFSRGSTLSVALGALAVVAAGCAGGSPHRIDQSQVQQSSPVVVTTPTAPDTPSVEPTLTPGSVFSPDFAVIDDKAVSSDGTILAAEESDTSTIGLVNLSTGETLPEISDVMPDCGFGVYDMGDGSHVFVGVSETDTAAQGIVNATSTYTLEGFDALTGEQLWSDDKFMGCGSGDDVESPGGWYVTTDGKYLAAEEKFNQFTVISVADGSKTLVNCPGSTADGVAGNYILCAAPNDASDQTTPNYVYQPGVAHYVARIPASVWLEADRAVDDVVFSTDNDAYSLATGKLLYHSQIDFDTGASGSLIHAPDQVMQYDYGYTTSDSLESYDAHTGKHLWMVNNIDAYCGATAGKAYVEANDALAILDVATGKQIDYENGVDCPSIVDNALLTFDDTGNLSIEIP